MPGASPDKDKLIAVTAFLTARRVPKEEIARLIGRGVNTVREYAEEAERANLLSHTFNPEGNPEADEAVEEFEKQRHEFDDELCAKLRERTEASGRKPVLNGVRVLSTNASRPAGTSSWEWYRRQRDEFSRAAAYRVIDLLVRHRPNVIANSWGPTVAVTAREIAKHKWSSDWPSEKTPVRFLPVSGQPFDDGDPSAAHQSATEIALLMHRTINRKKKLEPLSLSGIPAFLPAVLNPGDYDALNRLLRCSNSYSQIFPPRKDEHRVGDDSPGRTYLIDRMDMLLTSVSHDDYPVGSAQDRLLEMARIRRPQFQGLDISDVAGVPIPRLPKNTSRETQRECDKLVQTWESMWTGMTRKQLARCAGSDARPGVVVLTFGMEKLQTTLHIAGIHGLVNELICDVVLANGLRRSLGLAARKP